MTLLTLSLRLLWKEKQRLVDIIHELVGLNVLSLEPISSEIEVILPHTRSINNRLRLVCSEEGENNYGSVRSFSLDFYRLFRSYPPFEPLSIESRYNDVMIAGDYVWFIKLKNSRNHDDLANIFKGFAENCGKQLNEKIECDNIICGKYKVIGDRIIIEKLVIPRSIADGKKQWLWHKELELEIESKKSKVPIPLKIIYGYRFLKDILKREDIVRKYPQLKDLEPFKLNKQIMELLANLLSNIDKKRSRYNVASLDYMTWCYKGWEMCTDPFAVNERCTCCKGVQVNRSRNRICKDLPGYGRYHYSRKIFPKVYAEIDNEVAPHLLNKLSSHYEVPLSAFLVAKTIISSTVSSFSLFLPGPSGRKVVLEPEKKPTTPIKISNGLILIFHEDLVNSFIDALTTSNYTCKVDKDENNAIPLLDLLISKYIIYKALYEFEYKINFHLNKNGFIDVEITNIGTNEKLELKQSKDKFVKDIEFLEFVGLALSHTLAHVMLSFVSSKLNLDIEDLLYTYGYIPIFKDVQTHFAKKLYYAGIFENNDYGSIHLETELKEYIFKNNVDDIDISSPLTQVSKVKVRTLREVINKIISDILMIYDEIFKSIKELSEDSKNVIEKSSYAIFEMMKDKGFGDLTLDIVKEIVNIFVNMLGKSVKMWRSKGFTIDQTTLGLLIPIIIDEIEEEIVEYIANLLANKFNKVNKEVVEGVIDEFLDKYLLELVTYIEPNYCIDGCKADMYLERYCIRTIYENLLISRCLLLGFLSFIGIYVEHPKEFKVRGEAIERIINAANKYVYIQTPFISVQGIHALASLLMRGVNVKLVLDVRIKKENPTYLKDLEELKQRFRKSFNYEFTPHPDHSKKIGVDNLWIQTSWNYGTSKETLQNYIGILKTSD